ncbi:CST complex subunit Ten1 [Aspergillus pseudoustus]|uniref:CST complex subunit Ten1 n=1 Tax=Aspergillus pseudoustus TaxID=1810923 RepID=A0ABR4JUD6_9EURO
MNGPLPSTRAFVSDIPSLPTDSKIRFLGCVKAYHTPSGHLVLEHNYPRAKKKPHSAQKQKQVPPSIVVDINAVLETVTWEQLCVGAWVTVLGYVRRGSSAAAAAWADGEEASSASSSSPSDSVSVDAVVILPAGAVDIGEYERILYDVQEVERMRHAK